MDLKEVDILGEGIAGHWYYQSKALALLSFLGKESRGDVLDLGAGSGFFSRHLLHHTDVAAALCVDPSYAEESDDLEHGKPILFRKASETSRAHIVLLMDVLEHVEQDRELLASNVQAAKPGTLFLITAPAFRWLWSGHDDFLGHKRRYTLAQMERLVVDSGLKIERGAYFFAGVLPIAATLRILEKLSIRGRPPQSQLTAHHPLVNLLLRYICRLELPFFKYNRFAGLSVFCRARKPAG